MDNNNSCKFDEISNSAKRARHNRPASTSLKHFTPANVIAALQHPQLSGIQIKLLVLRIAASERLLLPRRWREGNARRWCDRWRCRRPLDGGGI
jgi:hypothetical protein